jgi:YHS domain-containing protein
MAVDPICGMTVDSSETPFKSEYQGRRVYFCCAGCMKTFERNPAAYRLPPATE